MVSTVIKNWDNKNWLSSKGYIKSFNKFLIRQIKLNSNSKILDIGCGRGKILGNLSSELTLKNKPLVTIGKHTLLALCCGTGEYHNALAQVLPLCLRPKGFSLKILTRDTMG